MIVLALFCVEVLETAQMYHLDRQAEALLKTERRVYPRIPVCDAELWDRIRNGCVPKNVGE